MEQQFNTSFIPKQALQADVTAGGPRSYVKRRGVMGPGYFLSLLVFIIALLVAIGLFVYTKVMVAAIDEQVLQLEEQQHRFQTDSIDELIRADARLAHARTLLQNHIAVSQLFQELEANTLRDVALEQFQYQGADPANVMITLSAVARGFVPVAQQLDQYRAHNKIRNSALVEIQRSDAQLNDFTLTASIDPQMVRYDASRTAVESTQPATQTSAATTSQTSQSHAADQETPPSGTSTASADLLRTNT